MLKFGTYVCELPFYVPSFSGEALLYLLHRRFHLVCPCLQYITGVRALLELAVQLSHELLVVFL